MKIKLSEIFTHGFGITSDPDGIDPEIRMAAFNLLYSTFITEFDRLFRTRRLRTVTLIVDNVNGNRTDELGLEGSTIIDDFEMPYDVKDVEGKVLLDEVFDTDTDMLVNSSMGYFLTEDRIFFPGVEDGKEIIMRYVPVPRLLSMDAPDDTEVYMSRLALPSFARGLAALYGVIAEESYKAAAERTALIFTQYFGDLGAMLDKKAPKQFSSFV